MGYCSLDGYSSRTTCENAGGTWSSGSAIKQYGYYLKGNKVAIVEKDTSFDNNIDNKDFGPGVQRQLWKSPQSSVTDGLEIEYVYSPNFTFEGAGIEGTDYYRFIGWGSDGTNLLLFTYGASDVKDLSSLFSADDWIHISGSGRWSGVHQVKSTGGTTGILTLKTKYNAPAAHIAATVDFAASSNTLNGSAAASDLDIEAVKDQLSSRNDPYFFIESAADTTNNGLFSATLDDTSGQITLGNKITIDADGDFTSTEASISDETNDDIALYNAVYEQIIVKKGINILSDEEDVIDLPTYLSKALVYYVKARIAEDMANIEAKEYFMREFKKMVEKHESSRITGPRMIVPGSHAIR